MRAYKKQDLDLSVNVMRTSERHGHWRFQCCAGDPCTWHRSFWVLNRALITRTHTKMGPAIHGTSTNACMKPRRFDAPGRRPPPTTPR